MVKKLLHPKAVLEAVVAFHVIVKAKALFLVVLGVPCLVPPLPGIRSTFRGFLDGIQGYKRQLPGHRGKCTVR